MGKLGKLRPSSGAFSDFLPKNLMEWRLDILVEDQLGKDYKVVEVREDEGTLCFIIDIESKES